MKEVRKDIRGRGTSSNIPNRFEKFIQVPDLDDASLEWEEKPLLRTQFFKDTSRKIITHNKSPDVGFDFSVNAYRGCEHGCAYCYARPTHEYLGYSAGLDFESKIFVKESAPELLRDALMSPRWKPAVISMSGVTDCYQPAERHFQLTRKCLEVLYEFKNPVGIITKNHLVTRDIDILSEMAKENLAMVYLSVTTLDSDLGAILEPRTSRPSARLRAIEELNAAGIPVGVNVAPLIPGLTDSELPAILKAARKAGARWAGFVPLRLPLSVLPLFTEWLEVHKPEKKEKVLSLIRDIRGGKLNSSEFGSRVRGEGPVADTLRQVFHLYTRREGLNQGGLELATHLFQRPEKMSEQLKLF